jgi:transposase
MGREREGPKRFLGNFPDILQSDGYGAYDHVSGKQIIHAACWAHARRKFFDVIKLNPRDQSSIRIVAQMNELFAIDAQARQEGLSQSDRHVLRLEKSQPLLEQIKAGIQAGRVGVLPKSALAQACDYTLTLWTRLSRFLEYPELEFSNNLAENALRPIAWLVRCFAVQSELHHGSANNVARSEQIKFSLISSNLKSLML